MILYDKRCTKVTTHDIQVQKLVFLCSVFKKLDFGDTKKVILFLYTSYFKVLSMTVNKQFCFCFSIKQKKEVHIRSWAVSKRLYLVNL